MRLRVVTRDFSKKNTLVVLQGRVEEYDLALLEPFRYLGSDPMVFNIEAKMVGDNYVELTIDQVVD